MCCKGKFAKFFAVLIIGLVALNFSLIGAKEAVNPNRAHFIPSCESLGIHHSLLDFRDCLPSNKVQTSNPMDTIFQIIFILFFISPPLIVLLLFLIWRELKTSNKLK